MNNGNDDIKRELRWLDPVAPGELDRAAETDEAAGMLTRIFRRGDCIINGRIYSVPPFL